MSTSVSDGTGLPAWVPEDVCTYLTHVCDGRSMRELARRSGCEPSTVSRRVRRVERRRDDPLIDIALTRLGRDRDAGARVQIRPEGGKRMSEQNGALKADETRVEDEARRILRKLAETSACLAVAPGMETAVVVRDTGEGPALRTAVVDRCVAEVMALKDWIARYGDGRILKYRITACGRAALRQIVAEEENAAAIRHRGEEAKAATGTDADAAQGASCRSMLVERPVLVLARRKDRDGRAFLDGSLVSAAERLREEFELVVASGVAVDWDALVAGAGVSATSGCERVDAAVTKIAGALRELGPGLSDVTFRCCCRLEGLEKVEREMGWSARSGKIVLRIALTRLVAHFAERRESWSPMIG